MNKLEDTRGAAFDLDGTLVDNAPGLAAAVNMALYVLGLPVAGEERATTWIGNGAGILMGHVLTWARQECAVLRKTMGKPPVDDDIPAEEQVRILRKLFDRYYGEVAEGGTFLFLHVVDTLGTLQAKGLPLGLVTNKSMPFVAPLLEALDITKYFNVVIGGDDMQNKKPHPDSLLPVAERMGVASQQILFVGNSRNDVQAAKVAGCPPAGLACEYSYGEAVDLSQPDVIHQSLNDLLPVLGLSHSENQESKNNQTHRSQWRTALRWVDYW